MILDMDSEREREEAFPIKWTKGGWINQTLTLALNIGLRVTHMSGEFGLKDIEMTGEIMLTLIRSFRAQLHILFLPGHGSCVSLDQKIVRMKTGQGIF